MTRATGRTRGLEARFEGFAGLYSASRSAESVAGRLHTYYGYILNTFFTRNGVSRHVFSHEGLACYTRTGSLVSEEVWACEWRRVPMLESHYAALMFQLCG